MHASVVTCSSEYLRAMLEHAMAESRSWAFDMHEVQPRVLELGKVSGVAEGRALLGGEPVPAGGAAGGAVERVLVCARRGVKLRGGVGGELRGAERAAAESEGGGVAQAQARFERGAGSGGDDGGGSFLKSIAADMDDASAGHWRALPEMSPAIEGNVIVVGGVDDGRSQLKSWLWWAEPMAALS